MTVGVRARGTLGSAVMGWYLGGHDQVCHSILLHPDDIAGEVTTLSPVLAAQASRGIGGDARHVVGHNSGDGVVRTALRVGVERRDLIDMNRDAIAFNDDTNAVGDTPFAIGDLPAMKHAPER
jgi:hypothetical protein